MGLTPPSPWPWVDHPASGLRQRTRALFGLAFAPAPAPRLNLARYRNSPAHSAKGTPSGPCVPPTVCRHTVSGPLSLPARGAFHLSLSVLCAIGHRVVFSLRRWSSQIPTGFLVSRGTRGEVPESRVPFAYGALTLYGRPSQTVRLDTRFVTPRRAPKPRPDFPLYPARATASGLSHPCGLGSSPFARRYSGNRSCFLFLGVLRCFTSPGSPPAPSRMPPLPGGGFPHSGTPGSTPACGSPGRFAACRALLRLPVPRHPPCAFSTLFRVYPVFKEPPSKQNSSTLALSLERR